MSRQLSLRVVEFFLNSLNISISSLDQVATGFRDLSASITEFQNISSSITEYQNISASIVAFQDLSASITEFQNISTSITEYQNISAAISILQGVSGLTYYYILSVGDGSETIFGAGINNIEPETVFVYVDGTIQRPVLDYTTSGGTVVFVGAPPNNKEVEIRTIKAIAPIV